MPRNRSQLHPVEVSNVYLAPNVYKARKLDEKLFETAPNANARPIPKRLNSYLRVRRHCVGAFAECISADIHVLLWETAKSAAKHNWRKVGATSPETAVATYVAIYRSRWGAEIALQGARLRLSRAYLAFAAQQRPTDRAYENTSNEFGPSDSTCYAAEAAPILGGPPEGQDTDRYLLLRRTSTSLARRTFDSVMLSLIHI